MPAPFDCNPLLARAHATVRDWVDSRDGLLPDADHTTMFQILDGLVCRPMLPFSCLSLYFFSSSAAHFAPTA